MSKPKTRKSIKLFSGLRLLKIIALVYVGLLIVMYSFQRDLMYFPIKEHITPADVGLTQMQDIRIPSTDGMTLQAWYHAPKPDMPLIIYVHGNGGHLGYRHPRFNAFLKQGFGVLGISYRGYGDSSESELTEAGLYDDAESGLNYAIKELGYANDQILFYGESLGTGVAVEMAKRHELAALVLESPYLSIAQAAQDRYFWMPVYWLVKDRYDSISKIKEVSEPLLIFHGEKDPIVPFYHAKQLFEAANEPKEAHFFPELAHGNFDSDALADFMLTFFKKQGIIAP